MGTSRTGTLVAALTIAGAVHAQGWDLCAPGEEREFAPGPYGTAVGDVVDDFTVPVLDAAGDPGASWSYAPTFPTCDVHVFVSYFPPTQTPYFDQFWSSSVSDLIAASPRNVHYFFTTYETDPAAVVARVRGMRDRVEAVLLGLPPAERDHWAPRFHYVTTSIGLMPNWISTMIRAQTTVWWLFGIDREQRLRRGGLVHHSGATGATPALRFATHEARYWNFEWARERDLAAETFTPVPLWDGEPVAGSIVADVVLPDPGVMQRFDTLLLDLELGCDEAISTGEPGGCPAWDAGVRLDLCDADDPTRCDLEIGRWITTYGRQGRWVTDASPYLAFLRRGGPRRFRFSSGQPYSVTARLLLTDRQKGTRPWDARFLHSGGPFDEGYNARHPDRLVQVPEWARRVELAALLTGHGWGVELANCAEFCDHQHVFGLNGTPFIRRHPEAGTLSGCLERIGDGVVPNQFGTWPFGRGGWCPGLDVPAWLEDVTAAVQPGSNFLEYRGLYQGQDYVPEPNPDPPGGFPAVIDLTSWLVFSIERPETACDDGTDEDLDGLTDCDDPGCVDDPACAAVDVDGDGVPTDADCAPLDPGAHAVPPPVLALEVTKRAAGSPDAVVSWGDVQASAGSATVVDLVTGSLSELRADAGFDRAECLALVPADPWVDDRPAAGGLYHVARARNWCGAGAAGRSVTCLP